MDNLPNELKLQILSFLSPADLWRSVRHINANYRQYADEVAAKEHIPKFQIGLNFTLSSGTHHRWYDVRGTVHTGFVSVNKVNPQYALFEVTEVLPKSCPGRVREKWKQICASGFGPEQEWRVTFRGDGILMKMPNLVLSNGDGVWCDWREMLDGYLSRSVEAWEGLARPWR